MWRAPLRNRVMFSPQQDWMPTFSQHSGDLVGPVVICCRVKTTIRRRWVCLKMGAIIRTCSLGEGMSLNLNRDRFTSGEFERVLAIPCWTTMLARKWRKKWTAESAWRSRSSIFQAGSSWDTVATVTWLTGLNRVQHRALLAVCVSYFRTFKNNLCACVHPNQWFYTLCM